MQSLKQIAATSKSSQGPIELCWLLEKLTKIKPKVIVEIGVHQGYSLQTWHTAFNPDILIGIDNDLHDLKWEKDAQLLYTDSHDPKTGVALIELLHGREIDFLFIDGDHMYDGVKSDFQMYAPLVRKGGIIAFDDMDLLDNSSVEVYKLWSEIVERWPDKTESIYYDSNGIGILYV